MGIKRVKAHIRKGKPVKGYTAKVIRVHQIGKNRFIKVAKHGKNYSVGISDSGDKKPSFLGGINIFDNIKSANSLVKTIRKANPQSRRK